MKEFDSSSYTVCSKSVPLTCLTLGDHIISHNYVPKE